MFGIDGQVLPAACLLIGGSIAAFVLWNCLFDMWMFKHCEHLASVLAAETVDRFGKSHDAAARAHHRSQLERCYAEILRTTYATRRRPAA
ncbi:MAG: hypothetical protein U0746_02840 [Gemmataceae bacterium]